VCCRDISTVKLEYLSSEQALADLAYFRLYMSDKMQLSNNKWIAFGGSYPGVCVCVCVFYFLMLLDADENAADLAEVFL